MEAAVPLFRKLQIMKEVILGFVNHIISDVTIPFRSLHVKVSIAIDTNHRNGCGGILIKSLHSETSSLPHLTYRL